MYAILKNVRTPTYYAFPGTIIFFDWEQDGDIDHVRIVNIAMLNRTK